MGPGYRKPTYSIEQAAMDASEKAGAAFTGLHNIPSGAVYGLGSGTNYLMNKVGIRDDNEYGNAQGSLNDFYEKPPYLPKEIQGYRTYQQDTNPNTVMAAEILGTASAIPAKAVARGASKVLTRLRPNNPMPVTLEYPQARLLGGTIGGGLATGKEVIAEPFMDAQLGINR